MREAEHCSEPCWVTQVCALTDPDKLHELCWGVDAIVVPCIPVLGSLSSPEAAEQRVM